jgi:uncharacterized membrane protein YkoI
MRIGNQLSWTVGLVAVLVLAGAAVTATARLTSAGSSTPESCQTAQSSAGDDECDADEAEDSEESAGAGQLDDGKDLLPQAGITLDAAIAAAQSAGSGSIGEVDLEHWNGTLVFNVDVGDKDVKVDAATGAVLSADQDD